ncbi:PepSY domain-containing protein [Exilibacterium tricleocarpae]|uniref:PepSY domain-containing protein n=1 Tax=Exilibacterium tricleocarpae TaxID=2591008 RepID=A0A545SQU5_9GAMM|nr:PepSY-associated TM helix domain-containing protein [Exilibacterium tricleocarpae]TQV67246.1 PepSY domain-containing protein [Exilibacterium tricleocarpae]
MVTKSATRTLATLHAWLGAVAAVFILAVSITGIAIAFSAPLLHLETGAFPQTEKRAADLPVKIDVLVAGAQQEAGASFIPLGYLGADAEIATYVEMIYGLSAPPDAGGEIQIVTFDAATDQVIGAFYLDRTLTHLLIDFHYELLGGGPGAVIVAALGLLMAGLAIVGLYLWWPLNRSVWRKIRRLELRGSLLGKSFSLHSFFGFWFALVVLVWSLTGVYWSQPEWSPGFIRPATASLPAPIAEQFQNSACNDEVTVDTAIARALASHSHTTLLEAEFATPWQPYHIIYLSTGSDIDKKDGDIRVWASSNCIDQVHTESVTGIEVLGAINASIHSGESFGALRVPIIVIVGLVLSLLAITGLIVWAKKFLFAGPRVH